MFLVADSPSSREAKIRGFLDKKEPVIAVLLAAADCERTMRRAILSLGMTPTLELAYQLGRRRPDQKKSRPKYGSSIKGYANAWKVEVEPSYQRVLTGDVVPDWASLEKAFHLRHDLIHGDTGTAGLKYSTRCVETLIQATQAVHKFASEQGFDLTKPIKKRLKAKAKKK